MITDKEQIALLQYNLGLRDEEIEKAKWTTGKMLVDTEALLESERRLSDELEEALEKYGKHSNLCIRSCWEAGKPTKDGGYRSKFAGKWYQSKPIDQTPKCNCGFEEVLSLYPRARAKEEAGA